MKRAVAVLMLALALMLPVHHVALAANDAGGAVAAGINWYEEAAKWFMFKFIDKCISGDDDWVARTCRNTVVKLAEYYVEGLTEMTDSWLCTRAWRRLFEEGGSHDAKMNWSRCILQKGLPIAPYE